MNISSADFTFKQEAKVSPTHSIHQALDVRFVKRQEGEGHHVMIDTSGWTFDSPEAVHQFAEKISRLSMMLASPLTGDADFEADLPSLLRPQV